MTTRKINQSEKDYVAKRILFTIMTFVESSDVLPEQLPPQLNMSSWLFSFFEIKEAIILFKRIRKGLIDDPLEKFHKQAMIWTGYESLFNLIRNEWLPRRGIRTEDELEELLERVLTHDCDCELPDDKRFHHFFRKISPLIVNYPLLGNMWLAIFDELLRDVMRGELSSSVNV